MKIGFSLGRCVRDIVNGEVSIDDVAFLITATYIQSEEQLENVVLQYTGEPGYLLGLKYDDCVEVAKNLWHTNRILQPRKQGLHRHMQPENSIWVDIFPTELSNNEGVKKAWDSYRFMLHMVENVDNEATEIFKVLGERMVKEGTKWGTPDGKEFLVMHVIEQEGHTWVHYRENRRDEPKEYSCYEESFLLRFRPMPE